MKKLRYYLSQFISEMVYVPKNMGYLFSNKKKAIYVGCIGHENLGDEAIFKAIKKMLEEHFYLYEISYTKPSSGKYLRKWMVRKPNYIFLGGGTIIRKGANQSYLKLLQHQMSLYPKAFTATLGPGVAEPEFAAYIGFPIDVPAWKGFLNNSNFISVRGRRSKKLLETWKVNKDVHILHDPAIWFTKETYRKKSKQKRIGLNIADIGNRIHGKNQDAISTFAFNLVERLQQFGWQVFLYPTTKSDLHFMLEKANLKSIEGLHIYSNHTHLEKSLEFLESLDVFIGQRLHSVIFAATVTTPFIALEYEPKTQDFLETIGMPEYSERVDTLDLDRMFAALQKLYSNLDTEQAQLHQKITRAKQEQIACLQLFLDHHL